jgi:nitrogen regulatory protein PII
MPRARIFNTMKKLEIALERDQLSAVCNLLDAHATGYTVIHDVTGYGHHGFRDGDIVLLITVVTRDHVDPILDELVPMLNRRSGVVLLSDVNVTRGEYFVPECTRRPSATVS